MSHVFARSKPLAAWITAAALTAAPAFAAGDADAGESKAQVCTACHGAKGISSNEMWPNLAGQKEAYLAKQTTAFREGDRMEPTMAPFVKSLSDQDVADLAAYYASLAPCPEGRRARRARMPVAAP